jgi:hypothetical protein
MNMIRRPTGGDQRETLVARNAAKIGKEFGFAGLRNEGAAIFRAEDTMNEIARICVRHPAPFLRAIILQARFSLA